MWMTCTFSREWSHSTEVASFLYCDRTASSSSSNLVDDIGHPGYAIEQSCIDVEEVDPNFVVAALICAPDAKRAVGDCEGTMHTDRPLLLGPRRFYEPTYISPLTWHVSWSPQRCGTRRNK